MPTTTSSETSRLLPTAISEVSTTSEEEEEEPSKLQFHAASGGAATAAETMTNMAKACMGTGCLALPFAAQQGGVLLHVFGTIFIAFWNTFSALRLTSCWELMTESHSHALQLRQQHQQSTTARHRKRRPARDSLIALSAIPAPPEGTATLAKVAWYALGPWGLVLLDASTVVLLLGIVVAYNDAMRIFLQDTPFTTHSNILDSLFIACMIAPLSVVPDMGYLTKTSAAGLTVLGLTLLVVTGYGIYELKVEPELATESMASALQWFPRNGLNGASQWFGCCVFGFGIVPLTFNFQESMAKPHTFSPTTFSAMSIVAGYYILIGIGLLALYPDIEGDVLSELPATGVLPVITRLAMVVVVLVSAPLLVVPCAEIIEGKLAPHGKPGHRHTHHVDDDEDDDSPIISSEEDHKRHRQLQIYVRFGICLLTVAISVGIPQFVGVLAFVGCFCVALVSFVFPPLLHLVLMIRRKQFSTDDDSSLPTTTTKMPSSESTQLQARGLWPTLLTSWRHLWVDALFLLWGVAATCISTAFVFQNSLSS